MPELEAPLEIGGVELSNRLYRAPLLECAGEGPDAPDILADELEPAVEAGAGLVCQGASPVHEEGGRVAPSMTPVADPEFTASLSAVPETIHDHGGRIFAQLDHGGLRSMEAWHVEYRRANPGYSQLAVSPPPRLLRVADRLGFLELDPHVLSTEEVYDLAEDFGRAAANVADAGYDGVHLAGANMGVLQQFLSPFYNRRNDEFADGVRFFEAVHDEIRDRAGDLPVIAKIPAETEAPPFVRNSLAADEAVAVCERLDRIGLDALVPVRVSTFWDMSIVRGRFPDRAWRDSNFREGYVSAFGSRWKAALVAAANRVEAARYDFEPAWNADLARRVRERVSVPVLLEGGIRSREQIDQLLGNDGSRPACDAVGMGRPFYAEPRLPARLLDPEDARDSDEVEAVCENCNNCTVPQVTGANGVCRTPEVMAERGKLVRQGAYERD
ncbi:NADH:flavin oxidoreductase [Halorussus lipolyticus]|uniref:oxidoreductase n=1 Tax=Halorussus lipolyticus TaxID=3034024 RepID=UPI0023E88582|nr:NADH:flavin oxidoreductase [Halorussus sp. DT80]